MSRFLRQLPAWPQGSPLPANGLLLLYDPGTDKEYKVLPGQVGGQVIAITLPQAQAIPPGVQLYSIASYPDPAPAPDPDLPPAGWNADPAQHIVLVQGLTGGTWASEGLLVLAGGGSQRVDVDVAAGTYEAQNAGGPLRDIYAVPDTVRDAVRHPGNTWVYGDLTAYNDAARLDAGAPPADPAGQPGNVLVGTAAIGGASTFDAFEVGSTTVAWRYTYGRRNDGTYGWTRVAKTA